MPAYGTILTGALQIKDATLQTEKVASICAFYQSIHHDLASMDVVRVSKQQIGD